MHIVNRASRLIAAVVMLAAAMAVAGMSEAKAQTQPPTTQPPNVRAFLANPAQLLEQYPKGGEPMAIAVQQLALADPAAFQILFDLMARASDVQKGSLGEGLAQAAKIEVLTNQELATTWQRLILGVTDPPFKTAAANAFADVQLGSVGGGALGAAGGGGQTNFLGQGSQSSGPPQNLQSTPTNTQPFTFATQPFTSTSTNTAGAPVSP